MFFFLFIFYKYKLITFKKINHPEALACALIQRIELQEGLANDEQEQDSPPWAAQCSGTRKSVWESKLSLGGNSSPDS